MKKGHYYCSSGCATADASRLKKLIESDEETDSYSHEELGEELEASSEEENETESESSSETESEQTSWHDDDTEETLNLTENESESDDGEESSEYETKIASGLPKPVERNNRGVQSEVSLPTLDEGILLSTSLVDQSIHCMSELMHSVRDNIKASNKKSAHPHVDPAQVNAAANCAREMANLMKLKLQIRKELRGVN